MARLVQNPDGSYTIVPEPGDENLPPVTLDPVLPRPQLPRPETPPAPGGTMSGNPFGTPVSQLALEMAVRNQQLAERVPAMVANQRELINRRLTRFGGDISQYEPFMDVGYQPTANALRSQAENMRDYLVGMPELMAKAMKEGEKSGVTYKAPDTSALDDFWAKQERAMKAAEYQKNLATSPAYRPSPDVIDRPQTTPRPAAPTTSRRLRPVTTNRRSGGGVSFR